MYPHRPLLISMLVVGVIMLGGWVVAANQMRQSIPEPKDESIAVTIYPLYDIVRNVVGDTQGVVLILPPGSSPHTYEPTPQDIAKLSQAQLLFTVGHGIDSWAETLAQNAGVSQIIPVDKNITLLQATEHSHEGEDDHETEEEQSTDPHYWLSVQNAQIITNTVAEILSQAYPEHAVLYRSRATEYQRQLAELFTYGQQQRQQSQIQHIATFHDAWRYFAVDFDLEVVATFVPLAGQEPSPSYLQNFRKEVQAHNLTVVYTEPQFSTKSIESFAADLGVRIGLLDPIGGSIDKDTYINLMKANIDAAFSL